MRHTSHTSHITRYLSQHMPLAEAGRSRGAVRRRSSPRSAAAAAPTRRSPADFVEKFVGNIVLKPWPRGHVTR
jgi:hypothetical protein